MAKETYEYHEIDAESLEQLNELGSLGWRPVAALEVGETGGCFEGCGCCWGQKRGTCSPWRKTYSGLLIRRTFKTSPP